MFSLDFAQPSFEVEIFFSLRHRGRFKMRKIRFFHGLDFLPSIGLFKYSISRTRDRVCVEKGM